MTTTSNNALLSIDELYVTFGALKAVDGISFTVPSERLVGLIGTNGAGKSTVINAISGFIRASRGSICLDGEDISRLRPHQRARRGIGRTFQNLELFASMSVLENVVIHWEARHKLSVTCDQGMQRQARERAMELLASLGLADMAELEVSALSYADRKLTEFARAIMTDVRLILLDEPAAGVATEERRGLVEHIRDHLVTHKITGIVVEHDMGVIRDLCSYVYVMDAGKIIARGSFAEVMKDEGVQRAYLGLTP